MSFLNFFKGPSSEKLEQKGDTLIQAGQWGKAKIEYERALAKAEKERHRSLEREAGLTEKIVSAKEALCATHQETAEDLIEGGYYEDAIPLISLALEITSNEDRRQQLSELLEKLESQHQADATDPLVDEYYGLSDDPEIDEPEPVELTVEEQFHAVCGTLPPEIQKTYLSYSENFKLGYIALNTGDFNTAISYLSLAMAEHSDTDSYIPLELATAHLNLGRITEARNLLEPFVKDHPETLPAYELLCDIYWEEKDFEGADQLLDTVPEDFSNSLAVIMLKGETLTRAEDFITAQTLYLKAIEEHGWQEKIAMALANVHEALGEIEQARSTYQEIMGRCTGCHSKINPEVKHRYAELSFAAGIHDTAILELYLSLAQEIPLYAAIYYDRVSQIYAAQGNEAEATRFKTIAKKTAER